MSTVTQICSSAALKWPQNITTSSSIAALYQKHVFFYKMHFHIVEPLNMEHELLSLQKYINKEYITINY